MTKRQDSIDALLARCKQQLAEIEGSYNKALQDKDIPNLLKIEIKNFCENLRSVLDYLAHDVREKHCPRENPKDKFYFPILPDLAQYKAQMSKWFSGLDTSCPALWGCWESVQPYQKNQSWLRDFNRLNNGNKHGDLVPQTKSERREVRVSDSKGGKVSWDPGAVTFGTGVFIGGVPVDPGTQLPVPSPGQTVEHITWVDFHFDGINGSALTLLRISLKGVAEIRDRTRGWL